MTDLLAFLNHAQQTAVQAIHGPVLVVAGAGTGKTRTLIYRLAYLVAEARLAPEKLLAITFTTRAAEEMRERTQGLCRKGIDLSSIWIGTIHALCYQILKEEGRSLNLPSDFAIISPSDHAAIIRTLVPLFFPEKALVSIRKYALAISREKNQWGTADRGQNDFALAKLSPFCRAYQEKLQRAGLFDFDDLILKTLELLHKSPPLAKKILSRFSHISVDEYQDVNHSQYLLIRTLAGPAPNLCVVGDADQAIYAFRGAQLKNFISFQHDFPGATVIHLVTNYRSTQTILAAAQAQIQKNKQRIDKQLIPARPPGTKIKICTMLDEQQEARFIAKEIERLIGGVSFETLSQPCSEDSEVQVKGFSDFAVLYRLHTQCRALKKALQHRGIPVHLAASLSLYEEPEVKYIINFLEVLQNPANDFAASEILRHVVKGIGPKTVEDLAARASKGKKSLLDELKSGYTLPALAADKRRRVGDFLKLLTDLLEKSNLLPLDKLIETIFENLSPFETSQQKGRQASPQINDSILELSTAAAPFAHLPALQGIPLFLKKITLLKEGETVSPRQEAVTLLTIHGAKGLEFPVVFVTGLEEGLFPYHPQDACDEVQDPEEERRLFYVAMTRAMERLYLLRCQSRFLFGRRLHMHPSCFLKDLPIRTTTPYVDPRIAQNKQVKQPKMPKQLSLFDYNE